VCRIDIDVVVIIGGGRATDRNNQIESAYCDSLRPLRFSGEILFTAKAQKTQKSSK
jgi:hypothetical protein